MISHSLWDWLAKPTAQDDGRHGSFPLEYDAFSFYSCLFLVVILGKHPRLGVDLSVNILGLYHLTLEEGTTTAKKCVEVDLVFSEASWF